MEQVKINTSKTVSLTLPSDPTGNSVSVSVYHEFGDLVYGPVAATRISTGVYQLSLGQQASGLYILNSAGIHKIKFDYDFSGTDYTQYQYINVFTPYLEESEFFENHPELEQDFGNNFEYFAKRARNAINTFCGQSFDYYPNKTLTMNGNNSSSMRLPIGVADLYEVVQDDGTQDEFILLSDTVDKIEKVRQPFNFDTTYTIRFKKTTSPESIFVLGKFNQDSTYTIRGDYGWKYVPENIKQASDILIADMMNNDSEYRNHGFKRVDMDAISFDMKDTFYESTGNIEADVLLMDYTLFVMDYII